MVKKFFCETIEGTIVEIPEGSFDWYFFGKDSNTSISVVCLGVNRWARGTIFHDKFDGCQDDFWVKEITSLRNKGEAEEIQGIWTEEWEK